MKSVLLERLRKASGARSLSQPIPFGSGIYGEKYAPETRRDFVEAYRDRGWVQRCVNYVANAVDSVPIKQFTGTKDDPTEVQSERLCDLLDRPNSRDPALKFFGSTAKAGQMIGEWYWEIVPAVDGGIAELFQLRGHLVHIIPDAERGGSVKGYTYDPNETGQVIEFDPAEPLSGRASEGQILAGRYANPLDDYYGMAPLRGAKDDVISEYYAVRYDHRFFRNSARPDLILAWKKGLDDEERKANREEWLAFKGLDSAHKAAILSGEVDVTELGKSPQDVAYLEGRKLAREGECGALGVPPVLVGILDRATYSNYQEAEPIFWRATMIPLLDFLASWATWTLLPYFPDVDWIEFDTSGVEALQPNENERIDRLGKAVLSGIFTPNEAREEVGVDEFDDPAANELLVPFNISPLTGQEDNPPPPVQLPPGDGTDPGTVDGVAEPAPPELPPEAQAGARQALIVRASAARYVQIRNATVRHAQASGRRAVAAVMAGQEREVLRYFTEEASAGVPLIHKAADLVNALEAHDWAGDATELAKAIGKTHTAVAVAAGEHAGLLLGVEVGFGSDSGPVARVVHSLATRPKGIRSVSGRVKTDVLEEVRRGIGAGLTHRQIAQGGRFDVGPPGDRGAVQEDFKGIRGVYSELKGWQAERIARTEAGTAYNVASAAAFRESGVQEVDIIDGDDDDDCAEANGSRWSVEDYDSDPLAHPNCTRIGLPVLDGG